MTNWAVVKVPIDGHISQADFEAILHRIGKRIGAEQLIKEATSYKPVRAEKVIHDKRECR